MNPPMYFRGPLNFFVFSAGYKQLAYLCEIIITKRMSQRSNLMKSPSKPITRLMIFCFGFLGDLKEINTENQCREGNKKISTNKITYTEDLHG